MADDLQGRQLVENAGIDQPRHAGGGLVRPAEAEPDLVLRRLLAGIVRKIRAAHGMHPDRQVVRHHLLEDRPELGRAQRLAGDIGEHLDAARAEMRDRAVDLVEAGLDIVHRQRRDERRKAIRMAAADLGQRIVRHARQLRRLLGRCDQLERRIGEADHLAQVVELIEQAAPRIDIDQRLQSRKAGHRDVVGRELRQAVEIGLRHEVIEDVDDHGRGPSSDVAGVWIFGNCGRGSATISCGLETVGPTRGRE